VFCRIVCGSTPASIVWEDELTLAFLDLRQGIAADWTRSGGSP